MTPNFVIGCCEANLFSSVLLESHFYGLLNQFRILFSLDFFRCIRRNLHLIVYDVVKSFTQPFSYWKRDIPFLSPLLKFYKVIQYHLYRRPDTGFVVSRRGEGEVVSQKAPISSIFPPHFSKESRGASQKNRACVYGKNKE